MQNGHPPYIHIISADLIPYILGRLYGYATVQLSDISVYLGTFRYHPDSKTYIEWK